MTFSEEIDLGGTLTVSLLVNTCRLHFLGKTDDDMYIGFQECGSEQFYYW